ncbi:hypothetical protein P3T20_004040 [Paraburkholderia sp. GAS206C]|jgi:hypothetical protein|uniref:hypothetical protein n=1 Tax=unclassified Paraburkholderia TaxID=2615204 RepID=UPI003D2177E1
MSPVPNDPQTAFILKLQSRYDQRPTGWLLSAPDIELWTQIVGSTRREAYNAMARQIAVGFHEGRLPFWFCDAVVNAIIGFVYDDWTAKGEDFPALFYETYLAFDAGEVSRPGVDPIETYTRPMIAKIVFDLGNEAG